MRRFVTPLLAVLVVGLTTGFLFVDLDEHGLLRPPPPIAGRPGPMQGWLQRVHVEPRTDEAALPTRFPATADGIREALRSRTDLLETCHRAWVRGDTTAPRQATARIRIKADEEGKGRIEGVDLDTSAGGVQTMQGCVTAALTPLAFTDVPRAGLVVLWTLELPDTP